MTRQCYAIIIIIIIISTFVVSAPITVRTQVHYRQCDAKADYVDHNKR